MNLARSVVTKTTNLMNVIRKSAQTMRYQLAIGSKMSLSSVAYCLVVLLFVKNVALESSTTESSHESNIRTFVPILKKAFNPTYIHFRPLVYPEEQYIYDEWGTTCDEKNRPTICRLFIVSEAFRKISRDDVSN
uniref:Uncharacterized protein n=1 Tax=Cacopsylla melanoneura TaxID=428564 RepID=A0A8D9F573_9HEMI